MEAENRSSRFQMFIGIVVLLLAAGTVAQTAYFQGQLSQQRDCLIAYQKDLNDALTARSATTGGEAEATKQLLLSVFNLSFNTEGDESDRQEAFRAAFQEYVTTIDDIKQTRQENPYPPFPEGACG